MKCHGRRGAAYYEGGDFEGILREDMLGERMHWQHSKHHLGAVWLIHARLCCCSPSLVHFLR